MRAIQILAYGQPFHYTESAPDPVPGPGEVLLRVRSSGLCSTATHLPAGRQPLGNLPRVPGHEIAGDVAEIGPGADSSWLGRRALIAIDVTCGRCRHCLTGQTHRCMHRQRIGFERDGGHADLVSVPAANLVPIPDALDYEQAAVLPDAAA